MLKLVFRNIRPKTSQLKRKLYCCNSFDFPKVTPIETKPSELPRDRKITNDVIRRLEAISLVNFGDEKGIKIVEDAISYADKLDEVDTDSVEPLFTVLENESLYLREDIVKPDINTADLLSHAEKVCEGYYTAPTGNISYDPENVAGQNMIGDNVLQMLKHFQKFSFLNLNKNELNLGHNGEHIKENILHEWLLSNSVTCDEPAFLAPSSHSKSDIWNTLGEVWSKVNVLPCSIVVREQMDAHKKYSFDSLEECSDKVKINSYFNGVSGLKLQRYFLFKSQPYENTYFKLQRERQIWWKKFSASPGRFSISKLSHNEDIQCVDVVAEFPWGHVSVETLKLFEVPEVKLPFLKLKPEKNSTLSIVQNEMILEKSTLTFLFDSFETVNGDSDTVMMRFHRKLAPFKISFSAIASTLADEKNLKDLAFLLAKQIRKYKISVLLLPDICSASLEDQIHRNDALGIPYTIIMDSNTLKNGLLGIRSRDTTLQEQSHVGSVIPYVEKLMKHY